MDGPGFHVEIGVLESASTGITRSVADQHELQLKRLDGPEAMYGQADLHNAMENFCDRWDTGIGMLLKDAEEIGGILSDVAGAYRAADQAAAGRLTSDPGEPVLDD
ncbi:hypothetical protein JIG36_17160 [Actinoplanes sp. LDG1-06]|uniref:Uncharacterized protein n=1 Tax=Paractinoplanes ovalisporus TaxID=2810368 RepID=A0ABS2ABX7_9ACTN|nr:hypothetical protein [Actinoplanes ovalisporus]MBM2617285.1 hypothetical protein [Actinoplanes ovalisporus]